MRFFTLLVLCCITSLVSAQTEHMVDVTSNVFTPEMLTIQAGDMVTWTNLGGVHNVNGELDTYPDNPEGFGNGNAAPPGWMYSFTFNTPGTYEYQCDPHLTLGMVGTIIVEAAGGGGNVVINEIMYNPPESGQDSLEFIELFNPGTADVNLADWTFTQGVEHTFTAADVIPAGGYLVVVVNESAFTGVFGAGLNVVQWTAGGLQNGGEDIELTDNFGNVIDYVDYENSAPWPIAANAEGSSLVLCDPASDNTLPGSWQAGATATGVVINGIEVLANPGAASDCGDVEPTIFWNTNSVFVNEDAGTLTFQVNFQNFEDGDFSVDLGLEGSSTATVDADYTTDPSGFPQTGTAPGVVTGSLEVTVTIVDDLDIEDDETIILSLTANTGMILGDNLLTITIFDNDSDVIVTPISDVNAVDGDGVATFIDSVRTVQGIAGCLDYDGNEGYQFFLTEPGTGDGIYVFSGGDVGDYQLTEGDELQITGRFTQFRGLFEIIPDLIVVVSSGNAAPNPESVSTVNESTESRYVELALSTETPTTDFIQTFGASFNATAVSAEGDTIVVRIDDQAGIDSAFVADFFAANAASGIFVRGYGSQFSSGFDAPFVDGYQILPCSENDFDNVSATNEPFWATGLKLYPNPTANLLTVELPVQTERYRLLDGFGRVVENGITATQRLQLDMSQIKAGVYYLQLFNDNEMVTRPVIKQ